MLYLYYHQIQLQSDLHQLTAKYNNLPQTLQYKKLQILKQMILLLK